MNGSTGFIHPPARSKREAAIRIGSLVKSSMPDDGDVIFRVTYIHDLKWEAELRFADDNSGTIDGYVTRPLSLLRRLPDPRNQKPAIEGMPAVRPLCAWCGRKLKPYLKIENHTPPNNAAAWRVTRRTFVRWDAYEDVFCTQNCSTLFAGAAYRGGFRRVRK